jgi:hypothetical protein
MANPPQLKPEPTERQVRLIALLEGDVRLKPLARYFWGALYALANPENPDNLAQAAQSMRELFEKFPEAYGFVVSKFDGNAFREKRKEIAKSMKAARPAEGWDGSLSVTEELRNSLLLMEQYLEMNRGLTRPELTALGIMAANPFLGLAPNEEQEATRLEFGRRGKAFQAYAHHGEDERAAFLHEFERAEIILLSILQPPPSQALEGIRKLIEKQPASLEKSKRDGIFEHMAKRQEIFEYFFRRLNRTDWVDELVSRDFFRSPPPIQRSEGGYSIPLWLPLEYLARVAKEIPADAVEICRGLPKTDNPRIYQYVAEIASVVPVSLSIGLKDKLTEGADLKTQLLGDHYGNVLSRWSTDPSGVSAALELADRLVRFVADPNQEEKMQSKRKDRWGYYSV